MSFSIKNKNFAASLFIQENTFLNDTQSMSNF